MAAYILYIYFNELEIGSAIPELAVVIGPV